MANKFLLNEHLSYSTLKKIFRFIFCCIMCFGVWMFYEYTTKSKLIYVAKKDLRITGTSHGRGSYSKRNLYLTNVHDAQTGAILNKDDKEIQILSYQWYSKLSLHRQLFFNKEEIAKANTYYAYFYQGSFFLILSNRLFGLSGDKIPSKSNYYLDMFVTSTQLFWLFTLFLAWLFWQLEDRYYSSERKKNNVKDSVMIKVLFSLFIASLFFIS